MSEQVSISVKRMAKKGAGGKLVDKICALCNHKWRGHTGSKCPGCGSHNGKPPVAPVAPTGTCKVGTRVCKQCDHTWQQKGNSKCPKCGYHTQKNKRWWM